MWPSTSPPRYRDLDRPARFDRAVRTVVVMTAAVLIGAAAGGASVLAIVSALTAPPRHDLRLEAKGREKPAPAEPRVVAAPPSKPADPSPSVPNPPTGTATITTAAAEAAARAGPQAQYLDQAQAAAPASTAPAAQAPTVPPATPVKPWPDALSRAPHPAEAATTAPRQGAPSQAAAAPAAREQRPDADHAQQAAGPGEEGKPSHPAGPAGSVRPARNHEAARQRTVAIERDAPATAGEQAAERGDDARPLWDFFGERRFRDDAASDRKNATAHEPDLRHSNADRDTRDRATKTRPGQRRDEASWRERDQWGGGFFGLFGRRDTWRDDREDRHDD